MDNLLDRASNLFLEVISALYEKGPSELSADCKTLQKVDRHADDILHERDARRFNICDHELPHEAKLHVSYEYPRNVYRVDVSKDVQTLSKEFKASVRPFSVKPLFDWDKPVVDVEDARTASAIGADLFRKLEWH